MLDMSTGICACQIGRDGSPCKHQFILWSNQLSESRNFLPYFNSEERQKYAVIATGSALDISYYEGLHDSSLAVTSSSSEVRSQRESLSSPRFQSQTFDSSSSEAEPSMRVVTHAQEKLQGAFDYLHNILSTGDNSVINGEIKFSERIQKIPISRLPSALHEFGKEAYGIKRKSRSKIFVQPGSASRRKSSNRSRQGQPPGKKLNLRKIVNKVRRPHKLSENVDMNVNNPNKSKGVMCSRTKTFHERSAVKKVNK